MRRGVASANGYRTWGSASANANAIAPEVVLALVLVPVQVQVLVLELKLVPVQALVWVKPRQGQGITLLWAHYWSTPASI